VPDIVSPDVISPDPPHNVSTQLKAIDHGRMDGWNNLPQCEVKGVNQCVSHYTEAQVPALSALATYYVVADHTFSFEDSPSWGGHLAVAAATQDNFTGAIPTPVPGVPAGPGWGCNSNKVAPWINPTTHQQLFEPSCIPAPVGMLSPTKFPYNGPFKATPVQYVPTIFDRLDAVKQPWRIYASIVGWSICPSFAECEYGPQHSNLVAPTQILTDAKSGKLPAYSVLSPTGPGGTGQHPPSSMLVGDNWIAKVVSAIASGPDWSSTAIFITYDDCGCFYDHVPPPGLNPDGTQMGLREPMVIVSPYAKFGTTDSHDATFASILRFAEETFGLPALSVNDAQAYDYSGAFDFTKAPTAPRVKLTQKPVPESTIKKVASLPPSDDQDT
jgi:phospholipase C